MNLRRIPLITILAFHISACDRPESSDSPLELPIAEIAAELRSKVFTIPGEFFYERLPSTDQPPNRHDPYAPRDLESQPSPRELLKSRGMTFPPGAAIFNGAPTSQMIVRNTRANLDLLDALLQEYERTKTPLSGKAHSSNMPGETRNQEAQATTTPER